MRLQVYAQALAAYTGVDDCHMDSVFGEIATGDAENESGLGDILRLDCVADVHDGGVGVGAQDDAFHHSDVGIGGAEIGGQGYDRVHCPLGSRDNQHCEDDEDDRQRNDHVEERSLYAPTCPIDRIRLSEDAAQATSSGLKQDGSDECRGH